DGERLRWLDAELSRAPDVPTLMAMHHPPFATGVRPWDELGGIPPAELTALAEGVGRHPQVRRLVSGHLHRTVTGTVAGRPALVLPRPYVQHPLAFDTHAPPLP